MDYFPNKSRITHATNLSVEYHKSFKVVTVQHASEGGPGERYVLLQCGAPIPELEGNLAVAAVIPVPITKLFAGSTTQIALLNELDRLNVLAGIADARFVADEQVLARIREGKTVEYERAGLANAEFVVMHAPSIVMASGNRDPAYGALRLARIPLVVNAEWLETTALGRAEWLKFMAMFLNEERRAEEKFDAMTERYTKMAARAKDIPEGKRVKVMTGNAFRGAYTTAGGQSYVAGLIRDAGGVYVWADNSAAGGMTVDAEAQLARSADADIWINGGEWTSLKGMLADDQRYASLKAWRSGQVWLYDRRVTAAGANEYWSRGVTQPDRILADLIKIFYPDLARDYEFEWYRQVPAD
jgi:iron complex transport system substrate-binding protein